MTETHTTEIKEIPVLAPDPDCPYCDGDGYTGGIDNRLCHCRKPAPPESKPPIKFRTDITLNDEQNRAADLIMEWLENGDTKEFRLGGYAGTGKTTLLSYLFDKMTTDFCMSVAVCAFTGKAASVLRKKRLTSAKTIHSTIYRPVSPESDEWELKSPIEVDTDLFIVDEASMLSTDLYDDLRSFNRPILFVGDPGQLEPVGDNPNLMADPDFVLQTIHRQAESNPILQLAKAAAKKATSIAERLKRVKLTDNV